MSLFQYYHWIIYLLLCFFPLPVFLAIRLVTKSWLTAGIGALVAMHLSTDGLYGLDPESFLWRGYGLSSQLFAMIFLPLALAYSLKYLSSAMDGRANTFIEELKICFPFLKTPFTANFHLARSAKRLHDAPKNNRASSINVVRESNSTALFWLAVLFTVLTAMGHLGIGIITMMSLGAIAISPVVVALLEKRPYYEVIAITKTQFTRLVLLGGISFFFLSYWIIPTLLGNDYHNISYWDPVWKFDSYGWITTLSRLFNGDLFDFGRSPVLTLLILVGIFTGLAKTSDKKEESSFSLSLLFFFWLLLYFGRTTWGSLIDLIPGMKEFHISRFLVGLHIAGIFLAPIGLSWLAERCQWFIVAVVKPFFRPAKSTQFHWFIGVFAYLFIGLLLVPPIYRQTISYAQWNDVLIGSANTNAAKSQGDVDALFTTLRNLPAARVMTGRGGGWGKDLKIAETSYFMHLSTYGIPTVLWMPETWSPNADIEQFFSESNADHYDLYNMRYVVTPPTMKPNDFWKFLKETPSWKLYETPTSGYFTVGTRVAAVTTDKQSFVNVVHFWTQSDDSKKRLFPEILFAKGFPLFPSLPSFHMLDEANYETPDGKRHNIFAERPVYMGPEAQVTLVGPEVVDGDMIFKTKVTVGENCKHCIVVLKETSHPNWRATVDGQAVKPITVFPFFLAVPLDTPGTHDIVFSYQPSPLKVALLCLELIVLAFLSIITIKKVTSRT